MEPGDGAATTLVSRLRRRRPDGTALPLACLALTALVFVQAPGRIVADTKLDLAIDPLGFMSRALHLWNDQSAFGHVPNQAFGYLFPMGPFFAAGDGLGVPAWIVQRAWFSLLLVVAVWGVVRLGRALGIGTENSRVIAGVAYALAPGVAAGAATSAGLLPAALLPWVIVPLVAGSLSGSVRRAAARSGVAVALMGGVNAASVLAVLPAPAIYLLTRRPCPRRRRLAAWWVGAVALATTWWVVPLLLQGRYGFDFLAFTEDAAITTAAGSAVEVLRGAGNWLAFVNVGGPWLPGAWATVAYPVTVFATGALAVVGVVGLTRRDCPERRFLALLLFGGVGVMAAGYSGAFAGPLAGPVRDLLDGPLAPFRNVGKFFPLVRIPVVLGIAHIVGGWLARPRVTRRSAAGTKLVAGVLAGVVLGAAAAPLVRGEWFPKGAFGDVPEHWEEAATWLDDVDASGETGRALVVPSAPFGEYTWGRPLDEPLQALAESPWAVRDLIPLGSGPGIRALDAVERVIDQGVGSSQLAPTLRRMGVGHVVVRNDLDWRRTGSPRPLQVRRVLEGSSGLSRVERLGPRVRDLPGVFVESGPVWGEEASLRAVEIYAVDDAAPVTAYDASGSISVSGGPEAIADLVGRSLIDGRATVLEGDVGASNLRAVTAVMTDSLRRRDRDSGTVRDNLSYPLADGAASPHGGGDPSDFPVGGRAAFTEVEYVGGVPASSSYGSAGVREPEVWPGAAFDGDPTNPWVSTLRFGRPEWVEITLDEAVEVETVTVHPLNDGPRRPQVREIEIVTDEGSVRRRLPTGEAPIRISLPDGPTRTVRVVLTRVDPPADRSGASGAGLREVELEGVRAERWFRLPPSSAEGRQVFAFSAPVERSHFFEGNPWREEPALRRHFTVERIADFDVSAQAVLLPGPARDALIQDPSFEELGLLGALGAGAQLDEAIRRRPLPSECGGGPDLVIDGRVVATALTGTVSDAAEYRPVDLAVCSDAVPLASGEHTLETVVGDPFTVTRITMAETTELRSASARPVSVDTWEATERRVEVGAGPATVLVVHEHFNEGWEAALAGERLAPVRVDGWQQGFVVPGGEAGTVSLTFAPGGAYRAALLAGGLLLLLLAAVAVVPSRREGPSGPAPARRDGSVVVVAVGVVALVTVAGALVLMVPVLARPRVRRWLPRIAGVSLVMGVALATASVGAGPGSGRGAFGPLAQFTAVAAVAALVASFAPSVVAPPRSGPGEPRRRPRGAGRDSGRTPHISPGDEAARPVAKPDTRSCTGA